MSHTVIEMQAMQAVISIADSLHQIEGKLDRVAKALEAANRAHYLTAANPYGWACRCGWRSHKNAGSWDDHLKEVD